MHGKVTHARLMFLNKKDIILPLQCMERYVTFFTSHDTLLLVIVFRMSPEIANLIRPLYPGLVDHPSVTDGQRIPGTN